VLDVWPEVIAYGILLVPRDLEPGERRPVVMCQHGRGGRPQDVCNADEDTRAYHSFGARLADQGFVVFAPQNLYIGEEEYRMLQRKCTPLKTTFFGPMVRQHEQALTWLASLPFVDDERIGFYGLSYGGKSAMLIPAVVDGYALSICSGDFNEEVWKHVSIDSPYSFMFTIEHDHSEFDFGEKVNYAELAGLIAPRPFFVERGHRDGVAPDEWVAYEYAKVRRLYVELGIGDRTGIEFFDGGHEIHMQGTFEFLHKYLDWPER
jgi:predicted peptidase